MLMIDTTCTPDNTPPSWVMNYLRRDVGITRTTTRYMHYKSVLLDDLAACIFNKITHDFSEPVTELRRNWYAVHYGHIITHSPLADSDKDLLRFKLYSHLQRTVAVAGKAA